MQQGQDLPLEMLMLMPAAALSRPAGQTRRACAAKVEAQLLRSGLELAVSGWFDAMAVLQKLRPVLAACPPGGQLTINLRDAQGFDQLALSALVVALRGHCLDLRRIAIQGVAPWCLARLGQTGADNLFGSQWLAETSPTEIVFRKTQA